MRIWGCFALLAVALGWGCDDGGGGSKPAQDAAPAPTDTGSTDAADAALPADATVEPDAAPPTEAQAAILGVEATAEIPIRGLRHPVHVVRTEGDVPHLYAADREDLNRVFGFLSARDRFWMMDLARRLATGRLSQLVGDIVIDTDITSRAQGLHLAAQRLWDALEPERKAHIEAFADGINQYIDAVRAGEASPPSEVELAYRLLGAQLPADLMEPYTALDVMAFAAVVLDQSTCARSEIERTAALQSTYEIPEDVPFAELRGSGLRDDLFYDLRPADPVWTTRPGEQQMSSPIRERSLDGGPLPRFPRGFLTRTAARLKAWQDAAGKVSGSNGWAISGDHTADGATLLSGDGHLPLAVPAYFHQSGLDMAVFGDEDWHVRGNFVPGLPALGVGTNGHVAWTFTCFYSDTVDYYREEVRLGDDGLPEATRFGDDWRPVNRTDETYTVREVLLLQSAGDELTLPLFETFDGRRFIAIEGEPAPEGTHEGLNLGEGWVIPGDTDGDGVVVALSRDATYLDVGNAIGAYMDLGEARDIDEFRAAQRRLAVFGSHFVAGDNQGNILATGYHASPCRQGYERTEDGTRFAPGSDPQMVLDGTRHGGFELTYNEDGTVNDGGDDPATCMYSFEDFPHGVNPAAGYLANGNNDPSGISSDGSLADGEIYIGGPWAAGFRAARIEALVAEQVEAGTADVAAMAAIQADTKSATGARWGPHLLGFIEHGRELAAVDGPLEGADARVADLYRANAERFEEVARRLTAWSDAGFPAASGVETFYHQPTPEEPALAVATMIWNAWSARFVQGVIGDEPVLPGDRFTDDRAVGRAVTRFLEGRGPDNPLGLTSWRAETEESVFFDLVGTEEVERSDELGLLTLRDALDFLASEPEEGAEGGFGTDYMDEWLWGLRHTVRFESILAPFVGDVEGFGFLIDRFAITTDALPVADELPLGDPRRGLVGFPRPGDQYAVDNADPDFRPTRFEYRDGPVKRMVIALHPGGRVEGQNIIPGGQSGLTTSAHFADQAAKWLGNEAFPLRFHVDQVVEGAVGRELYFPPDE